MTKTKGNIDSRKDGVIMVKGSEELEIRKQVTIKDKQILNIALDGISGWDFNPIAVITNNIEDYYFICKVKTIIENLQMKMAKIYIKIQGDKKPRLLSIEEIV